MSERKPKPETLAAQALGRPDPTMRGLTPPIYPSATYERDAEGGYPGGHSYTRDQNPTWDPAEELLCRLEGGSEALLFASGMAAATTLIEALPRGARVIAPQEMYWTFRLWLAEQDARGRVSVEFVPAGDLAALDAALGREPVPLADQPPSSVTLVWVETPANPMGQVTDLSAAADLAHAAGARLAVDSTLATPVNSRPIEHGADWVMHSATKQLNGHADVVAGALVTAKRDEIWDRVHHERAYRGAILGPFEAWLLLRGMRTLFVRVERASRNAQRVAEALAAHPNVTDVYYPGLGDHVGHEVAARQMDVGFGPIVSFRTGGGRERAREVAARLSVFTDATSLGGVESLVEHRASVEGAGTTVPDDLLRLSIGIEDVGDLVADLDGALSP